MLTENTVNPIHLTTDDRSVLGLRRAACKSTRNDINFRLGWSNEGRLNILSAKFSSVKSGLQNRIWWNRLDLGWFLLTRGGTDARFKLSWPDIRNLVTLASSDVLFLKNMLNFRVL